MIFYFTGTGNSLYAAQKLSSDLDQDLVSIAGALNSGKPLHYTLGENEIIGFVYPVYAWQPPYMVDQFVAKMELGNYSNQYIFSLCTCGDEEGYTTKSFKKTLSRRGFKLNSAFTLVMPNNYLIGYNLDSPRLEERKLTRADEQLGKISSAVAARQNDLYEIKIGTRPFWKSYVINPMFKKYAMDTRKFYATDACTACGLCADICNTENINVTDKPAWGKNCIQCMACINRCPERAIEYGSHTLNKGRYVNPKCRFPV